MSNSQLVSLRVASTRIVLRASPAYLAKFGTPTHPRELAEHQVIACSYWSGGDVWLFTSEEAEVQVRVKPIHANSDDTCGAAALEDQGIVLQPDFWVGPDMKNGTLVELMPMHHSI